MFENKSRSRFRDLYTFAVDSGVCLPFNKGNGLNLFKTSRSSHVWFMNKPVGVY